MLAMLAFLSSFKKNVDVVVNLLNRHETILVFIYFYKECIFFFKDPYRD